MAWSRRYHPKHRAMRHWAPVFVAVIASCGRALVPTTPAKKIRGVPRGVQTQPRATTADTTTTKTQIISKTKAETRKQALDLLIKQQEAREPSSPEARRALEQAAQTVVRINALEPQMEAKTDAELRAVLTTQEQVAPSSSLSLEEVFAVAREAAWRVLGLRAFDVQLLGGIIMASGGLAEMATGEGKTLAAVAPTLYKALENKGCLVITANEYLARRDADGVGQVFRFLGLSVGLIESSMSSPERRDAYQKDIVYVSSQDIGFDYLRDQLAYAEEDLVLPSHKSSSKLFGFALVDEADSIMIDEARTPLVISERDQSPSYDKKYALSEELAKTILRKAKGHYSAEEKTGMLSLEDAGVMECEALLRVEDLYDPKDPWAPFIQNALRAKEFLLKDRDYVITDNEIKLVDTFSGRILEGRRYSDGLHQAVEVKENLKPSPRTKTSASVTFQSLFRDVLSDTLAGMTGTASTDADEFLGVYGLRVVPVPTALPVARKDYDDAVYKSISAKFIAAAKEVRRAHLSGRPVLIGTTSVEDSESFAELLRNEMGLPNVRVLNAKPEALFEENRIVADAGRLGAITVATNMAGRGTDVVLGGDAKFLAKDLVERALRAGSLTKHPTLVHEAKNDEDELIIKAAEDVLSQETRDKLEKALQDVKTKLSALKVDPTADDEADVDEGDGFFSADEARQLAALASENNKAPGFLRSLREAARAVRQDVSNALSPERQKVLELGGLYVIGTERHEARRIDRQLRGRSGRQGDPGASRFFVSVDDRMYKLFGGDSLKKIMSTFRVGEDLPVEAKSVTDALTSVQKKVEERNFGLRSAVLKFDNVLADHRRRVYGARRRLLLADEPAVLKVLDEWISFAETKIAESVDRDIEDEEVEPGTDRATLLMQRRLAFFGREFVEANGDDSHNAKAALLEKVRRARPQKTPAETFAQLGLLRIDKLWADHLENMAFLQEAVQFRTFQQVDPYDEFVQDAFELYKSLDTQIKTDAVYSLFQLASSSSDPSKTDASPAA